MFEERIAIFEGAHEYKAYGAFCEQRFKFHVPFRIDRSMTGDGFDKHKPAFGFMKYHDIGHLPMGLDNNAELFQEIFVEVTPFICRVSDVDNSRAGRENGTEFIDDVFDQHILATW